MGPWLLVTPGLESVEGSSVRLDTFCLKGKLQQNKPLILILRHIHLFNLVKVFRVSPSLTLQSIQKLFGPSHQVWALLPILLPLIEAGGHTVFFPELMR